MEGIGIVGTGISGLHLALYLQQRGISSTLYSARPMADFVAGPIPNLVTRWGPTLARERALGVADPDAHPSRRTRVRVAGTPIEFIGTTAEAADTTDFRLYLPRLLEAYLERGGDLRVTACGPEQVQSLAAAHDLLVVAAGRDGFGGLFPVDTQRSPHAVAPRAWTAGLFAGAALPDGVDIEITVVPGVAEIFHVKFRSFSGLVSNIGVAAIPNGPLAGLHQHRFTDDPPGAGRAVLAALAAYAPHLRARIDQTAFAPVRPLDIVQAAILPVVRRAWACVGGHHVMAVGDAWILNDPIVAQGANLASRAAFALGGAIAGGGPYDQDFCRRTEEVMWAQAAAPTAFTNAFLAPPPPHVIDLLSRAGTDGALADDFVNGFAEPEQILTLLAPHSAPA